MTTLRTIFEFILGWTKDIAELRAAHKGNHQNYQ